LKHAYKKFSLQWCANVLFVILALKHANAGAKSYYLVKEAMCVNNLPEVALDGDGIDAAISKSQVKRRHHFANEPRNFVAVEYDAFEIPSHVSTISRSAIQVNVVNV